MRIPAIAVMALLPAVAGAAEAPTGAAFDPFIAPPARLSDGVGTTLRLNSIPDTALAAEGTQVSIEPFELYAYKKLGPVSGGVRLPISFNPDRSRDDAVLQVISADLRAEAVALAMFRLYAGLRGDIALNAGVADKAFPDRKVAHTLRPYATTAAVFGPFSPQLTLAWHHALETKTYWGAWYADSARGFAVDLAFPWHFPEEKLTVFLEVDFDRDTDHGKNRGFVTPGVRFLPYGNLHFGCAVAVPVMDEDFSDSVGIGVILTGGYEFN